MRLFRYWPWFPGLVSAGRAGLRAVRRLAFLSIAVVAGLFDCQCSADQAAVAFESDIRPIFAEKCGKCHSDTVRKGDLDLSSMNGLRRGGESGEPAIAEALTESLLWTMLDGGGMPPEDEPPLTDTELALIRDWISTGASSESPTDRVVKELNQHDVVPILLLRCTTCHGPRRQDGGLDLHTLEAARKGGQSGPAFVPGDPDASLMIQRIESAACPPRELLLKFFVKRPPNSEVEILRTWIAAGAPEVEIAPDVATTEPDPLVTDEDRQHWAFQPVHVAPEKRSIDDFVIGKLNEAGLTLSPEADRDTLIRRAYLNLLGMPPSVDEWQQWRACDDPDWYQNMVDHLLASPHYGERWGRYWLDLAGYADSEGGISADPVRELAWKYRDYVIRSFNNDKPYDRFLLEQIAGDELIDHEHVPTITQEIVDNLVATGFLRMGIDQTGSRTMNFVPERLGVIDDAINVLGSSLLGLTLECARCHSHKYDAIPQRDYYRFKAIFQGALDEHDWLSFKTRTLDVATPEHRDRVSAVNPPLKKKLKSLESDLKLAISAEQIAVLRSHYPEQAKADRDETVRALKIADNNRTLPQRILVEKLQRAATVPDSRQPPAVLDARRQVAELEHRIAEVRRQMESPLAIRALWDRGDPSPTYILLRGEHDQAGRLVGPGVPSVLTDGQTPFDAEPPFPNGTPKTGRRLAFARWLTDPDHPLTARVMVNRIWYLHFGTGLVKTLENFGVQGARPSHPELLDWLAAEFFQRGWSIKHMHRLIMNSRVYRQSSRITAQRARLDPQNRLLSRMPLQRMDAEALRDSLLFVSGKIDKTPFGPPDPITVDREGEVKVTRTANGGWRRSIYAQYRRTEIPTMMETFDYPEMGPNCVARNVSIVSPQSLLLMNNEQIHELAVAFAERVKQAFDSEGAPTLAAQVDTVYRQALSRPPTDEERRLGIETLNDLQSAWPNDPDGPLATYCHTILNSAAFLYID